MIRCQIFARPVRAILILVAILATGIGSAFAEELPFPPSKDKAARIVEATISDGQSRLTIAPALREDPSKTIEADDRSHLVALPRGTTSFQLEIEGASQAEISAPEGLMIMRGQPVLRVFTSGTDELLSTVTVRHNGQWADDNQHRLYSPALQASLGATLPVQTTAAGAGSFLVIYAPAFTSNIVPLVDWKTLKGYQVATVSTAVTGASTSGIKDYIRMHTTPGNSLLSMSFWWVMLTKFPLIISMAILQIRTMCSWTATISCWMP